QGVVRHEHAIGLAGEIHLGVAEEGAIGKVATAFACFRQATNDDVVLLLDLIVGKQLFLAHVDPDLLSQVADSALLGELVRMQPATKRGPVHDVRGDAYLGFVEDDCGHAPSFPTAYLWASPGD